MDVEDNDIGFDAIVRNIIGQLDRGSVVLTDIFNSYQTIYIDSLVKRYRFKFSNVSDEAIFNRWLKHRPVGDDVNLPTVYVNPHIISHRSSPSSSMISKPRVLLTVSSLGMFVNSTMFVYPLKLLSVHDEGGKSFESFNVSIVPISVDVLRLPLTPSFESTVLCSREQCTVFEANPSLTPFDMVNLLLQMLCTTNVAVTRNLFEVVRPHLSQYGRYKRIYCDEYISSSEKVLVPDAEATTNVFDETGNIPFDSIFR